MAIEIIEKINVDFYDKKYILINAKQYDNSSRWVSITCYNQGDIFNLSANKHSAYVKFRKADGHGVLNYCKIKKINLNLVVIYYTQINLFLYIQFSVTVADVDIMVEMGGVEPPS